ncbi:MAG TPA: threonine-phosphate decarboxylase CobD [Terriglobia bacterium]|nr:threonine-phosphate decarboxylase CobD [Terriglobia bacterium]
MALAVHGGDIFGAARRLGVPVSAIMDFSANINPLGPSSMARRRLREDLHLVCHYPDTCQAELRSLVARHENIDPDSILFGSGAMQLIHLVPRHFEPRKALLVQPTFSEYAVALRLSGCQVRNYRLQPERNFRIEPNEFLRALANERPDMLILGNPNNPTGTSTPPEVLSEITTVCAKRRIHLVVDESFIDFTTQPSLAGRASQHRYLMVLRSFTKFFSLPGLRIGCLVAQPSTVGALAREIEPWSVNTLGAIAAAESMKDSVFRKKSLALAARERRYLSQGLAKLGWLDPYPSEANFLLARIKRRDVCATDLRKELEIKRLLIRECTGFDGLGQQYIRLAIRTRRENRILLEALREIGNVLENAREK